MVLDPTKNFAKCSVSAGYDTLATSIVLSTGDGGKLPAPATDGPFNLVWWNSTDFPDPADDANKEIVRCTARTVDTLTIARAQEGTTATAKNLAGKSYKVSLDYTGKFRDDIEAWMATRTGYGESVLATPFNITAANGVYQETPLSALLPAPSAGTAIYRVSVDARVDYQISAGLDGFIVVALYNFTDSVYVPNTERNSYTQGVVYVQKYLPLTAYISTTTAKLIKLHAKRDGTNSGWLYSQVASGTAGYTVMRYERIA